MEFMGEEVIGRRCMAEAAEVQIVISGEVSGILSTNTKSILLTSNLVLIMSPT